MAKETFSNGDYVKGEKWSGESFLGVLEYTYNDGSHCVVEPSTAKRFNVLKGKLSEPTEEEIKEIKKLLKENNIKPYTKVSTTPPMYAKNKTKEMKKEEELDLEAALQAAELAEED